MSETLTGGEVVTPRFVPITEWKGQKSSNVIKQNGVRLTVTGRKIERETELLQFKEVAGWYESCFFKK